MGKIRKVSTWKDTSASLNRLTETGSWSVASMNQSQPGKCSLEMAVKKMKGKLGKGLHTPLKTNKKKASEVIFFKQTARKSPVSFPVFKEEEILTFPKNVKQKLCKITQDFDVESDDEVINQAVTTQKRQVLRSTKKLPSLNRLPNFK